MASSPASVASPNASKTATMLTPRSPVMADLTTSDNNESDAEPSSASLNQPSPAAASGMGPGSTTAHNMSELSASDADDEEQPVQRPRGRMAARMMGEGKQDSSSDINSSDGEGAYARIRKQLLGAKGGSGDVTAAKHKPAPADSVSSDTAQDSPVIRKRRVVNRSTARPSRSPSTQTSTPNRQQSRLHSPGLFVSPATSARSTNMQNERSAEAEDSDPELPSNPLANKSFLELVAKKKKELREREAQRKKKAAEQPLFGSELDDEADGSRLTQQARPTRKASKKAIEEMNRETQRISRNMQLAHQARTKKTFRTSDLFARFNFRPNGCKTTTQQQPIQDISATSKHASDAEDSQEKETPPTSPPSLGISPEQDKIAQIPLGYDHAAVAGVNSDDDLPDIQLVLSQLPTKVDKGKGKAVEEDGRHLRIGMNPDSASDDELEIIQPKKSRFPVFDRVPVKKSRDDPSLARLRALAHLNSPTKSKPKNSNTLSNNEMQTLLRRRALEQAKHERQERIDELRARGVIIETVEEREREQLQTENLLEKARQEAESLRIEEKAKAKREGKEGSLSASDDEDEDWRESGAEDADMELSGSGEEDEDEQDEGDEDMEEQNKANPLLEDEAELSDGNANTAPDEAAGLAEQEHSDDETDLPSITAAPRGRAKRVIMEDDEEDEDVDTSKAPETPLTPPAAVAEDIPDLGLGPPSSAPLGLTQMFAGTMAEDENRTELSSPALRDATTQSLDILKQIPVSTMPDFDTALDGQAEVPLIQDSQQTSPKMMRNDIRFDATQVSDMPDPTQDSGFTKPRVEIGPSLLVQSTADTVATLPLQIPESPAISKKGRLRRRKDMVAVFSDDDDDQTIQDEAEFDDDVVGSKDAFNMMLKSAERKAAVDTFDKKTSRAKQIVQEQAEESEDEYAGLGGASDDESNGDLDEDDLEMIDDQGNFKGDERKLAAFYADKERVENEKQIDKLYKDIASGALRRKRGADIDLSDSEDDAAEERRRRKQREFAKMRKALLEDEKLGKIAENPKKAAFLRAVEDREPDSDLDLSEDCADAAISIPDSQDTQSITQSAHDKPNEATKMMPPNPLKRRYDATENDENHPPSKRAHPRRTAANHAKRPATLAEVRDTLSFLVEDSFVADSQMIELDSDSDDAGVDSDHDANRPTHRQTHNPTPRPEQSLATRRPVVDRLSQTRAAASASNGSTSDARLAMAFHAPRTGSSVPGFRPPSLLRRATTGQSSNASSGASTPVSCATSTIGGVGSISSGGGGVRRGASTKSNIHYQAREAERKKVVDATEKRRQDRVKKVAVQSARRSVLGFLGKSGSGFE